MEIKIPVTWQRNSLSFVKACLTNTNLSGIEAIDHCIAHAEITAEANLTVLLAQKSQRFVEIVSSTNPQLTGEIFLSQLSKTNADGEFAVKSISEAPYFKNLKNTEYFLEIPLRVEGFAGSLLFFYNSEPELTGEFIGFCKIAQGIFIDKIRINNALYSLELSRKQFDYFIHSIPEAFVIFEDNTPYAWVNEQAAKLFSIPEGKNNKELVSTAIKLLSKKADNSEEINSRILNILSQKRTEIYDWPWYFSKPHTFLLKVSFSSISWGKVKGTIWKFKNPSHVLENQIAQGQVKELTNMLSSVLNSSHSGIASFEAIRDESGNIVDFKCLLANETAKRYLGKKAYELINHHLLKVFPEYKENGLFEKFVDVTQSGKSYQLEYYDGNKGIEKWFQVIAAKLNDGLVVTFYDITNQKNAEENLRQNETNLKALIENTGDLIWSLNNDLKITTINNAFRQFVFQLTGISLEVGDAFDLNQFPEDFALQLNEPINRISKGEKLIKEVKFSQSGVDHFYEFAFTPIRAKTSSIIGTTIFGRNVTSRTNAETKTRQNSQILNSLLQNVPVFIFQFSTSGKIIKSIGAGLKNLQMADNNLTEKSAFDLFPGIEREISKIKKGSTVRFLSQGALDDKECFFENFIFPDESLEGGVIGFAFDITEQKQNEMELEKAKIISERANQAKNKFIAAMSHDLRTPIHAILGFAHILKTQKKSGISADYIQHILSSGNLLLKLVDDTLELSKIEEGKIDIQREVFHFKETLLSNLHPYHFQATQKGLAFELNFDKNIPDYLIGDSGKISRILVNLISNSLKFTSQGFIKVNFKRLPLTNDKPSINIRMSVLDTGLGIPKDKQSVIFNSFTQAGPSIGHTYGGSGLGLSIVKELTLLMGGELGVESPIYNDEEKGSYGSNFWLTLPLEIAKPDKKRIEANSTPVTINYKKSISILLVEDNTINQQLTKVMLHNIGCNVSVVDNGLAAIEKLRSHKFDLVLMDFQMPVMGGVEATKIIRKDFGPALPIIGLSANIYKSDIDTCLASGMNDHLGKPFLEKELANKIRKWVPLREKKAHKVNNTKKDVDKITDLAFLTNLYHGDSTSIKDMLKEYVKFQDGLLKEMENSIAKNDFIKAAKLAHKLRSSIRTVGLDSLHSPLILLEKTARQSKDPKVIGATFKEIKNICLQANGELKSTVIE